MNNVIILSVGISGSGKSHFFSWLKEENGSFELVEPDQIRKSLLGDINDQSQGARVFNLAYSYVDKLFSQNKNCYFSSTGLSMKKMLDQLKPTIDKYDAKVIVLFFKDSENLDLCRSRVKKDLDNNIDRSKIPEEVIQRQYNRYKSQSRDLDAIVIEDSAPWNEIKELFPIVLKDYYENM